MTKTKILIAIIVIALGVWFFTRGSGQEVSKLDTIDTVGNFYDQWLEATREPLTADPSRADLADSPILSEALRTRLTEALKQSDPAVDPVLCQATVPVAISLRSVLEDAEQAQVLITSKDKKVTDQALVSLTRLDDGWYINDIECSSGEFGEEKEFSFESEGYLMKGSIPAPYDSKNWHLVYSEDGDDGHVVPLFFDKDSQCTSQSGEKSVCKPESFSETTKVLIRGQMTERGVSVKQQEFLK